MCFPLLVQGKSVDDELDETYRGSSGPVGDVSVRRSKRSKAKTARYGVDHEEEDNLDELLKSSSDESEKEEDKTPKVRDVPWQRQHGPVLLPAPTGYNESGANPCCSVWRVTWRGDTGEQL